MGWHNQPWTLHIIFYMMSFFNIYIPNNHLIVFGPMLDQCLDLSLVGSMVGSYVGSDVGSDVGSNVGSNVGSMVGSEVGSMSDHCWII